MAFDTSHRILKNNRVQQPIFRAFVFGDWGRAGLNQKNDGAQGGESLVGMNRSRDVKNDGNLVQSDGRQGNKRRRRKADKMFVVYCARRRYGGAIKVDAGITTVTGLYFCK